jgi:arginine N-succinyltransferase
MLVVRSVKLDDLDALFNLVQQSELGLTTLKISRDELADRIEKSIFAFHQKSAKPAGQPYVFVMEDLAHGTIVGTSAIYSKVGGFEPFYTYQIKIAEHESKELGVHKRIEVLHLVEEHDGPSEIGSLFLLPQYWGHGHGRMLSITRFLFMAEFPKRFETEVIAEMRGVVDESGVSPLWAALGSHFFQIDYPRAETLSSQSKKFIADLMPRHPIYIPLLPKSAQDVIGKVHENTRPAKAVLEKEGFVFRDHVDIFDGGPALHCNTADIRSVKESRRGTVSSIQEKVESASRQLMSNSRLDFKAALGDIAWHENDLAIIDQVTALRLNLKVGDCLRAVNLSPAAHVSRTLGKSDKEIISG